MGCTTSFPLISHSSSPGPGTSEMMDVVRRCKRHTLLLRRAMKHRRKFAMAQALYLHSLKNLGLALKEFSQQVTSLTTYPALGPRRHLSPRKPILTTNAEARAPDDDHHSHLTTSQMITFRCSSPSFHATSTLPHENCEELENDSDELICRRRPVVKSSQSESTRESMPEPILELESQLVLQYSREGSPSDPFSSDPTSMHYGRCSTIDIFGTPLSINSLHDASFLDRDDVSSPNFYSPSKDELDPYIISSDVACDLFDSNSWLSLDIFTPSHIPYLTRERERTMKSWVVEQAHGTKKLAAGRTFYEEYEAGMDDALGSDEFMDTHRLDDDDDDGMPELEEIDEVEEPESQYVDVIDDEAHSKMNAESGEVESERLPNDRMQDELERHAIREHNVEESKEEVLDASHDEDGLVKITSMGEDNMYHDGIPELLEEAALVDEERRVFTHIVLSPSQRRLNNEVVRFIHEQFERAYKSGECVSGVLIPKVFYRHPNKGSLAASDAIPLHPSQTSYEGGHTTLPHNDMVANHDNTLRKLYAWEKKLYDEVKEGELTRMTFDQTCRLLFDLAAKDGDSMVVDRIKVTLKELDAQLLVALTAIQATSVKIENLTSEELYPQLCQLLVGLMDMWKIMTECHQAQEVFALEIEEAFEATTCEPSKAQRDAATKLENELLEWIGHLSNCLEYQKKYIADLYVWSQMYCQINDGSNDGVKKGKEDTCDSSRSHVCWLLKEWGDSLTSLESNHKESIHNMKRFASDVHLLKKIQSRELKLKKHEEKYVKKLNHKHSFSFRKLDISSSSNSSRWWEERSNIIENHKISTLEVLKEHLPNNFKSMTSFAEASWKVYENIHRKTRAHCVQTSRSGIV